MQRTSSGSILPVVWLVVLAGARIGYAQCELDKLLADDGTNGDWMGYTVAISGDVAVVGAPKTDIIEPDMGAAYVFQRVNGNWVQTQRLVAPDARPGDFSDHFGWHVAIDGNVIAVGAPFDEVGSPLDGVQTGSVYIFRFDGAVWLFEQKITPDDGDEADRFGWGFAVQGDTVVVGARNDDDNGPGAGSAYVFQYDGSIWAQTQKIFGSSGGTGFFAAFGVSVAIDGDALVIGAPWDDAGGLDHGAAYAYRFNGSEWDQEQLLLPVPGDGGFMDRFGLSVAVDDETIMVSATQDDDNGFDSGSVFVFQFDTVASHWVQRQQLVAAAGITIDLFGYSLALTGDTLLSGTYAANDSFGAAFVFRFDGTSWEQTQTLQQSDADVPDPLGAPPFFGQALDVSGDLAVIGAPHDDNANGGDAGAAYFFIGISGADCNDNGASDACDILFDASPDANGNGIPDECDQPPGDADADGDVDLFDFAAWLDCVTGPQGGPVGMACEVFDFDADLDVDNADLKQFLLAFTGP